MLRHRVHAGSTEIVHGLSRQASSVGAHVVKCELVDVRACLRVVKCFQRFGHGRMEPTRAGKTQLVVQRFLQQRMTEVIDDGAGLAALAQHPRPPQLVQRREQGILLELADEGKRVVRCARSDYRNEVRETSRPRRE